MKSAPMMPRLRRWYMQITNVSVRWGDRPGYIQFLYWLWSRVYDLTVSWDPAFRRNARRMVDATVVGRVLRPGGRLGLFLAEGEIAPLFSTRPELEEYLSNAGFVDCHIEDSDDVYRIVTAGRPSTAAADGTARSPRRQRVPRR